MRLIILTLLSAFVLLHASQPTAAQPALMDSVRIAKDQGSFALDPSGKKFVPWGFNYDHDDKGDLIEDYWDKDWDRVADDFKEMKQLGANVVRVHLQYAKFMTSATNANDKNLGRLSQLLALAEKVGLYLDFTGLGCYHKKDVPPWYDKMSEKERWETQAHFWEAIARTCAKSPAVFCYDLMNEPVVPGQGNKHVDWLGPPFGGKHFVQFITLETMQRQRHEVARAWIQQLVTAIRKHDKTHLITVGLVDWSLDRPGLTSGFVPDKIAADLDFLCVHLYPKTGKVDEALQTLKGFAIGKPVLIEETFPLQCSIADFKQFIDKSTPTAAGWIGFYWGKTADEYRKGTTLQDALMLQWLEFFEKKAKGG